MKNNGLQLDCLLVGTLLIVGGPQVFGISFKDIASTLTADPKRFESSRQQTSTLVTPPEKDDAYRGRAQELRPDISVPPPAGQNAATQPQEAPHSQMEDLISGLERVASVAPAGDMDEIPLEPYRPANSAQKYVGYRPRPVF